MIPRGKKSSILQRWREQGSASATEEEIATLLAMPVHGNNFYRLLAASEARSRASYGSRGYVFAQIGINAESVFGNSFINNETFQQYACHGYLRACLETHLSIMKRFNSMLAMAI